jgi:hypothetical protein
MYGSGVATHTTSPAFDIILAPMSSGVALRAKSLSRI